MVNVCGGPAKQDPDASAHREVVLLRRAGVHDDVVERRRRPALDDAELGDLRVGVEGHPEGRRAPGAIALPSGETNWA